MNKIRYVQDKAPPAQLTPEERNNVLVVLQTRSWAGEVKPSLVVFPECPRPFTFTDGRIKSIK